MSGGKKGGSAPDQTGRHSELVALDESSGVELN
jgi:hypothetical protein